MDQQTQLHQQWYADMKDTALDTSHPLVGRSVEDQQWL